LAETSNDSPPDRLSLDPRSEHFDEALLSRGVGIRFNGQEKTNVIEYCVSQGWIRVAAGRSRDRFGQPMTLKLQGQVEPYYENPARGISSGRGRRFRRIGRASAALVAPLVERPSTHRNGSKRRNAAPCKGCGPIAEDGALGA